MSPISNLWRQLVQRRLWPVAVLLVAALAAVPVMLAKEPESEPAAAPQASTDEASSELATEPIVAMATTTDRAKRRKVLGKAKNPFVKPASPGSADSGPQPAPASAETGGNPSGPEKLADNLTIIGGGGGGSAPSFPTGPTTGPTAPDGPDVKPVRHARHSITVRFGDGDNLSRMNVKKLEPLPLGEEPLVVYLGVADGGKAAVFLVDSSIGADGDGRCMPDENTCEEVHLREGETEFFDILDENGEPGTSGFQLDLLEIHGGKQKGSSPARTAAARASALGALKDRAGTSGVARTAAAGLALP
jgi:hypothetical protein